jgi:class 3 adenylate cyclase
MTVSSRHVVMLMTDIVGSVDWQSRLGIPEYIRQIKTPFDREVRGLVDSMPRSKVMDHIGDGYLIEFANASDAVAWGLKFQARLSRLRADGDPVQVRMGVHQGEVALTPDAPDGSPKMVGMAIGLTARLMGLALPGQLLLSQSIHDDARTFLTYHPGSGDKADPLRLEWRSHGRYQFKGFDQPMEVFEAGGAGIAPLQTPTTGEKAVRLAEGTVGTEGVQVTESWSASRDAASPGGRTLSGKRVALLYKRKAQPDEWLLSALEQGLGALGAVVFIDRHMKMGVEWAQVLEKSLTAADAIVPLLSAASVTSEMLEWELDVAFREFGKRPDSLRILPVRVDFEGKLPPSIGTWLDRFQYFPWHGPQDTQTLLRQIERVFEAPAELKAVRPPGGVLPLDSRLYVERPTDRLFSAALLRNDPIVLVHGSRQMGKTSLVARGNQEMRQGGGSTAVIDCQQFSGNDLATSESLYRAFSSLLAEQLDLPSVLDDRWNARLSPNMNFDRYLRKDVLGSVNGQLTWFLDEVDRLFPCKFSSEVFGLFRSFYNARGLDPASPLGRLTIVISYATEAQFFITDVNQSPFNVGTKVAIRDFTLPETETLNERYGSPLRTAPELQRFFDLINGHPYLSNRGLYELSMRGIDLLTLMEEAPSPSGPFGDHLRRIIAILGENLNLEEVVRDHLKGRFTCSAEDFFRLRSAGIMSGDSPQSMRLRSHLYRQFLERYL